MVIPPDLTFEERVPQFWGTASILQQAAKRVIECRLARNNNLFADLNQEERSIQGPLHEEVCLMTVARAAGSQSDIIKVGIPTTGI